MSTSISQVHRTGFIRLLDTHKRHIAYMIMGAVVAAAVAAVFAVYGWDYYTLDQASRPFSPKHADL